MCYRVRVLFMFSSSSLKMAYFCEFHMPVLTIEVPKWSQFGGLHFSACAMRYRSSVMGKFPESKIIRAI